MTKVQDFIERTAVKKMQFHAFAKEWRSAITTVWVLKLFTACVSVYAGVGYLANIASGAIGQVYAGWVAAVVMLFLLESLNATALFKGFKFMFRGRHIIAAIALIVALCSFTTSFFVSVNGIEEMQTAKADGSQAIVQASEGRADEVKGYYNGLIAEQQTAIARIEANPLGWSGGRRENLTKGQLAKIETIQAEISNLRDDLKKELSNLSKDTKNSVAVEKRAANANGEKYYKLVAALMLVQLFSNFALTFFYAKIFSEKEADKEANEDIEVFAKGLFANMYDDIKSRYANLQYSFSRKASAIFSDIAESPVSAPLTDSAQNSSAPPANAPLTPQNKAHQPANTIGFRRNSQQPTAQTVAHAAQDDNANYYYAHRPELCEALVQQAQGERFTTNRKLASEFGCSEATVRNCRRSILKY